MAGSYSDVPGPRMAFDVNGSVGFWIDGSNTISTLSSAQLRALNNESTDTFGPMGGIANVSIGLLFQENEDLVGLYFADDGKGTNSSTPVVYQTSTNTTNGLDGTWTTITTGYGTSWPNIQQGGAVVPNYRSAIQTVSGAVTGVKAFRVDIAARDVGFYVEALHLYSNPSSGQTRFLAFWDPSLDQELGGAALDWANVAQSSSSTKTFRIKNAHGSLTASNIRLTTEALTEGSPAEVPQFSFFGVTGVTAVTFRNQIIKNGPLVYWPLDDGAGSSTAADASGNGRVGAVVGTPSPGFGQTALISGEGTSLGLTGDVSNANYIRLPYSSALDVGLGDFTIEVMVYSTNALGIQAEILGRDDAETGNGVLFYLATSGGARIWCAGQVFEGSSVLNDSQIHHVTIQRVSGLAQLFVDGKADGSHSAVGSLNLSSSLRVGALGGALNGLAGRIGHFAYYNYALSQSTIERDAAMALTLSNTGYSTQALISSLTAGSISNVITLRRIEQSNATLGLWAIRHNAQADSWT